MNPFLLFLSHLFNVMSIILMIAVALALAVEEWIEGGVIALIVVLNTCVGFYQVLREAGKGGRGERRGKSLRDVNPPFLSIYVLNFDLSLSLSLPLPLSHSLLGHRSTALNKPCRPCADSARPWPAPCGKELSWR